MKSDGAIVIISDDEDESEPSRSSKSRLRSSSASSRTISPEPDELPIAVEEKSIKAESQKESVKTPSRPIPYQDPSRKKRFRGEQYEDLSLTPTSKKQQRRVAQTSLRKEKPIEIEDDDAEADVQLKYDPEKDILIDLEQEDEVKLEEELFRPGRASFAPRQGIVQQRNIPIEPPWVQIVSYKWKDSNLKPGKTVELADSTFLLIKTILVNLQTDKVRLRGLQLKRSRDINGMLPMKVNELCYVYEVDQDDKRSVTEQNIVEHELRDVLNVRRVLHTNRPYPECRFERELIPGIYKDDGTCDIQAMMRYVEEKEILVVRWKYTSTYETANTRLNITGIQINFVQQNLETLTDEECSAGLNLPGFIRRIDWRGDTALGGSGIEENRVHSRRPLQNSRSANMSNFVDLSLDDDEPKERPPPRKSKVNRTVDIPTMLASVSGQKKPPSVARYTFGDSFCGAGGTTRGAVMSGLQVKYGFDYDNCAGETWQHNFRSSRFYEQRADEFISFTQPASGFCVDILHLSPPCQVFSPIKVREGKNDESNFASLFAVRGLIEKVKPRMVTLEQTFGILHNKHKAAFHALIRMFTDHGFSVSWQVVKFQNWGLAQSRRRLIILAACPGETLPNLPAYTHSETGCNGLKPYTSVRSVISSIPRNAPNHDLASVKFGSYGIWDDSSIITCMTTVGAVGKEHPSGERKFTMREIAALQSFPIEHVFKSNHIRRQIGNAVPPLIAKIILTAVREHLEKADKKETEGRVADFGAV